MRVDLARNTAAGRSDAQGDSLTGFENVTGGGFADSLLGDGSVNILRGGGGNDFLQGRGGGDRLDGEYGNDTLSYEGSRGGVTVNLATNSAAGGDAEGDIISGFENLRGGFGNDRLTARTATTHCAAMAERISFRLRPAPTAFWAVTPATRSLAGPAPTRCSARRATTG